MNKIWITRRWAVAVAAVALAAAGCASGQAGEPAAAAAGPSCPEGTTFSAAACIETALRPDRLDWKESNLLCLSEGRRIPALHELQMFLPRSGGDQQTPEWHNLRYRAGEEELAGLVNGAGQLTIVASTEKQVYRCVAAADFG